MHSLTMPRYGKKTTPRYALEVGIISQLLALARDNDAEGIDMYTEA